MDCNKTKKKAKGTESKSKNVKKTDNHLIDRQEIDLNKIIKIAKGMGINSKNMEKTELIRAIQRGENNIDCYGTQRVENCHEDLCLWRADCLGADSKKSAIR